jgi:hypothetical protein
MSNCGPEKDYSAAYFLNSPAHTCWFLGPSITHSAFLIDQMFLQHSYVIETYPHSNHVSFGFNLIPLALKMEVFLHLHFFIQGPDMTH